MPLFDDASDPAGGASESLREFEDALASATEALGELETGAGDAGGGGAGADQAVGGRRRGRGGLNVGRIAAGLGGIAGGAALAAGDVFLSNALVTGSAQSGAGAVNRGIISAAAKVPILGALLGANQANTVLGRAEGRVGGGLADLARQGVAISDEMIQQELDVVVQQEQRATEVEARVRGATGSSENVRAAGGGEGLAALTELVQSIATSLEGLSGGSTR